MEADHQRVDADPDLAEARVVDLGHGEHAGRCRPARRASAASRRRAAGPGRRSGVATARVKTLNPTSPSGGAEQPAVEVGEAEALADTRSVRTGASREVGAASIGSERHQHEGRGRPGSRRHHSCVCPCPCRAGGGGRDRQVEVVLEDPGGHRRGRIDAETAPLERDGDHDLGILGRREDDVPGLVGLVGALGGSGLAGHGEREVAEDRIRGAARLRRGAGQPGHDRVPGGRARCRYGAAAPGGSPAGPGR